MNEASDRWVESAKFLNGPAFAEFQRSLTRYNASRLVPSLPEDADDQHLTIENNVAQAEVAFVEAQRKAIAPLVADVPDEPRAFIAWFEQLKTGGPGQGDRLFPWLAESATADEMKWFLNQEVAGEAGFDDLVAMTQVKMPVQAKLEMARNYWDEMGRGRAKGMHGPLLDILAQHFEVSSTPETVLPESLALSNTMIALARHRRYAFHSVGALGVIEMTAPTRAAFVDQGLRRLKTPPKKRHYFALHAILDVKHSQEWNREVIRPLVEEDPRRAKAIAEGAVIRLWHGERAFAEYRSFFEFDFEAAA